MNVLISAFAFFAIITLSSCSAPLVAAGIVGNVINRTADIDDSQSYISDTGPSVDSKEVAITNLNLGIEYMRRGEYEKALAKLNRAREAKFDYAPIYNALGLLYQKLRQMEEAEMNYKHSIKLDGENPATLNNYGQFLCSQDRSSEAEKYFLAAAENPLYDLPEVPYANIGTCAYLHNETDKAIGYFEKALSLNPKIPAALLQMSEINYQRGNYDSAHDYLIRYLQYTKHTPRSLWLGIRIERELGNKNAVSSYAMLLRNKYPDSNEAQLLKESGVK
ncbi:MAG: type IV pilus biogenesis/stability protein PilW [Gammaproteobacteria bacterium]|nr:type IV pilus biogenesis/stability protein PilW [Gammaproteobacteria bacterium]